MRIVYSPPTVIRHGQRHIGRAFSTSRVVKGLPPARLRALISLFHISSSFITPATLSDRIDLAFACQTNLSNLNAQIKTYPELRVQLHAKRSENKVGPEARIAYRGIDMNIGEGQIWSDQRAKRQSLVNAALWGTDWDGKPSLETALETSGSDEELTSKLRETESDGGPSFNYPR